MHKVSNVSQGFSLRIQVIVGIYLGLNVNDVLGKLKSANTKEPSGIDINVKFSLL
jgi:hypothetical protein